MLSKANHETVIERDAIERYMNSPYVMTLESEIRKACYTLFNFTSDNRIEGGVDRIPTELLFKAKGIAFFTILKAGFFLTGKLGTGLVLRRLSDNSWSAPSAIGMSGAGWGFQVGGEITDVLIILNTEAAVDVFTSQTQVSLGTALGVSLGPIGRSAGTEIHAGDTGISAAYSYAHSKGLFVGVSLEAAVIASRPSVNRAFYGESVEPALLLSGRYPRPVAAEPLYRALSEISNGLSPSMCPSDVFGPDRAHDEDRVLDQDLNDNVRVPVPARSTSAHNEDAAGSGPGYVYEGLMNAMANVPVAAPLQLQDKWTRERQQRLRNRRSVPATIEGEEDGEMKEMKPFSVTPASPPPPVHNTQTQTLPQVVASPASPVVSSTEQTRPQITEGDDDEEVELEAEDEGSFDVIGV